MANLQIDHKQWLYIADGLDSEICARLLAKRAGLVCPVAADEEIAELIELRQTIAVRVPNIEPGVYLEFLNG